MQNLPANCAMIPVRRVNTNPQERGLAERASYEAIPRQAAHAAPCRSYAPDETSRLVDSSICEIAHGRYPRRVFKSHPPHRPLRLGTKQPRWRDETRGFHSARAEFRNPLLQLPPRIGFTKVKKLPLTSGVGLGHQLFKNPVRALFFPEVAPPVQDSLVPLRHPLPKPMGEGSIA